MIALDSDRWGALTHAYGFATETPGLLSKVYANPYNYPEGSPIDEVWNDLWGSLCHQGDIGTASLAAVPHFVNAAIQAAPGVLSRSMIDLPVAIEESRIERPMRFTRNLPVEIPNKEYFEAIERIEEVCELTEKWGRDRQLAGAVRSARSRLFKRKQKLDLGPLFRTQEM